MLKQFLKYSFPLTFKTVQKAKFVSFNRYFTTLKVTDQKTFDLVIKQLQKQTKKCDQLQKKIINDSLGQQISYQRQKIVKQINRLTPIVSTYNEIQSILSNLNDLYQMKQQTSQQSQKGFIQSEITQLQAKKQKYKKQAIELLIPPDVYDDVQQITIELRPGVGGTESALFVQDMANMYINYCQSKGWKTSIVSAIKQTALKKGYRIFSLKVVGSQVYKIMKCESGVHKVIRVPETESKGRLHSSTISMAVMPAIPFDFVINDKDIKYEYMKSSGPGGQSVNKTQSACRATHIPSGISVVNQQDRSQDQNKKKATQILKKRLFEIQWKKNIQYQSSIRKIQIGTMDRSEKIRTYNFPQDRITDHRTGLTLFGIDDMMSGEYIDKFINSFTNQVYEQKLQFLLNQLSQQKYI